MRRRHVLGPCTDTPSNRHLPFSRAGWHVVLIQEVHNPPEEPVIPLGGIHTAPDQVIERVLVPVVVVCQQDLAPLLRSCSWRASGQGAGAALGSSAFMAPLIAFSAMLPCLCQLHHVQWADRQRPHCSHAQQCGACRFPNSRWTDSDHSCSGKTKSDHL